MRKQRKKFTPPKHPWRVVRLKDERELLREYGLRNHKEIWRAEDVLRNWKVQAKTIVSLTGDQREEQQEVLISKLIKLGVLKEGADLDDVLGLTVRDVLERRLQTIIYKKSLALTPKQSRQIIVHNKVLVNGRLINSPAHKIKLADEVSLIPGFSVPRPAPKPVKEAPETEGELVIEGKPESKPEIVAQPVEVRK
jgi:small subunit ribosomal protein S4